MWGRCLMRVMTSFSLLCVYQSIRVNKWSRIEVPGCFWGLACSIGLGQSHWNEKKCGWEANQQIEFRAQIGWGTRFPTEDHKLFQLAIDSLNRNITFHFLSALNVWCNSWTPSNIERKQWMLKWDRANASVCVQDSFRSKWSFQPSRSQHFENTQMHSLSNVRILLASKQIKRLEGDSNSDWQIIRPPTRVPWFATSRRPEFAEAWDVFAHQQSNWFVEEPRNFLLLLDSWEFSDSSSAIVATFHKYFDFFSSQGCPADANNYFVIWFQMETKSIWSPLEVHKYGVIWWITGLIYCQFSWSWEDVFLMRSYIWDEVLYRLLLF